MRKILSFVLIPFVFAILLVSCWCQCCDADCGPVVYFELSVFSSVDSTDLFASGTFVEEDIVVETLGDIDGSDVQSLLIKSLDDQVPDRLQVSSFQVVSPVVISLSPNQRDTLDFRSTFFDGDCCDQYQLDSFSLNGAAYVPLVSDQLVLFK